MVGFEDIGTPDMKEYQIRDNLGIISHISP